MIGPFAFNLMLAVESTAHATSADPAAVAARSFERGIP
jgi:hypothetical protein